MELVISLERNKSVRPVQNNFSLSFGLNLHIAVIDKNRETDLHGSYSLSIVW